MTSERKRDAQERRRRAGGVLPRAPVVGGIDTNNCESCPRVDIVTACVDGANGPHRPAVRLPRTVPNDAAAAVKRGFECGEALEPDLPEERLCVQPLP